MKQSAHGCQEQLHGDKTTCSSSRGAWQRNSARLLILKEREEEEEEEEDEEEEEEDGCFNHN